MPESRTVSTLKLWSGHFPSPPTINHPEHTTRGSLNGGAHRQAGGPGSCCFYDFPMTVRPKRLA
jgi:hypothetical protein